MSDTAMRVLTSELRFRAAILVDYLITQPRRQDAMKAAQEFAWWCAQEGAIASRRGVAADDLARPDDGTAQGAEHAKNV